MTSCVIVTGASRGIGAAIAHSLAAAGFEVGCLSRSGELPAIDGASPTIKAKWHPVKCDVTRVDQLERAVATVIEAGGAPLRGLVNNAGIHTDGPSQELSGEAFMAMMNMNALTVLTASQVVYPHLAGTGGLIVNIGSFFDKLGVKRNLAYCASKAAVGAITRCLAVEWATKGIRVLNVAPGYIVTDLNRQAMQSGPLRAYLEKRIPGGQPGQASDIGELVASLFTTKGTFFSGETLYADGAQGIAG